MTMSSSPWLCSGRPVYRHHAPGASHARGAVPSRRVGGLTAVIEALWVASFLGAGALSSWLVPALIFLLVVAVSLGGLRWIRSEHLDALASVPLFSSLPQNRLL